ncbi:CopG family ribbon-helix-helix protein [Inquilinus sp. NPDC058860]|jgi:predicted transcriptional regulator|uniref:CopG family ribbon-helix-helix protein n=1 Tax=Inquilinus sp. NPDC058860 TaxID=3346652 RepID=UPI00367CD195
MTDTNFTFRVDEDLKAEFTRAAKANDRPASILLRDFMRDYVNRNREASEYDAWVDAELEQRLREADDPATKWIPHEQVMDEMEALLKERIARAAKRAG